MNRKKGDRLQAGKRKDTFHSQPSTNEDISIYIPTVICHFLNEPINLITPLTNTTITTKTIKIH